MDFMAKRVLLSLILCVMFSYAFSQELSITNSLPSSGTAGQDIEAKYTLTKSPTMGSFAKFQVDLPAGFNAQSIDIKGGNFTFENNRVKIVWVSLPGDASFDFTFKMTPASNASGNVSLAPQFFYLENNVKKEYAVPPASIDFGGGGGGAVATDNTNNATNNTTTDNSTTSTNNTTTDNSTTSTNTTTDNTANNNTQSSNTTATDNVANNNTSTNTNTQSTNTNNNTSSNNNTSNTTSNTSTTSAKSNVVYHIQLAALTNKPNKARFAEYGTVKVVEDAGLFKVLVGKFTTLADARAYKKTLIAKGAEGVFVVAYENGVRVKIN
jgi:hypothetical protein